MVYWNSYLYMEILLKTKEEDMAEEKEEII